MNVYVRELSSALARAGVRCDVFTRAWSPDLPDCVTVEPGFRVHHVPAGALAPMAKEALPTIVDEFTEGVLKRMVGADGADVGEDPAFDAVHANYWLSGLSGHVIKHELNVPFMSTFHTLDRVKAEASPEEVEANACGRRAEAEASIIQCSDTVLASCSVEAEQIVELYGADPSRIRIVAPGVDHAFFGPGCRPQARRALGFAAEGPLLLFVGRIQPLKGADVAVRTLAALSSDHPSARLVVVGGPSGPHGQVEVDRLGDLVAELGLDGRVAFVAAPAPRAPLDLLPGGRRLPCPQPVRVIRPGGPGGRGVWHPGGGSDVGGLQTLVDHGRTGFLVEDPTPEWFAAWTRQILAEPLLAERLGTGAVLRARRYTWARAAGLLRQIYEELTAGRLVECS